MPAPRRVGAALLVLAALLFEAACQHAMTPPKPYLALVSGRGSNGIAVVNLARFKIARLIPLDFPPDKLVPRPGHDEVFITSSTGALAALRFPGFALDPVLRVGKPGEGSVSVVFSPDGRLAYVLSGDGKSILTIDCESLRTLASYPSPLPLSSIALDAGRQTILGEDPRDGKLAFFTLRDGTVVSLAGALTIGRDLGPMVVAAAAAKAFVAQPASSEVTAIDLATRNVLAHIEVGSPPGLLALKPDNGELFALSGRDSTMTILNVPDDSVEESRPSGAGPAAAVFSRDSGWLYIANARDGTVTRMAVQTRQQYVTHVGLQPVDLALTPDERFLAVVDATADRLTVIRAHTGDMVNSVPVGADPVSVVIPGWLAR